MKNNFFTRLFIGLTLSLAIGYSNQSLACWDCCTLNSVLEGNIDVKASLEIKNEKGKDISIPKGFYKTTVFLDYDENQIGVRIKKVKGTTQKFEFALPPESIRLEFAPNDYSTQILGLDIGQPFDLDLSLNEYQIITTYRTIKLEFKKEGASLATLSASHAE